jgi:hypothetical protein
MWPSAPLVAAALLAVHPAAADPPSPASGHAAVVAQGLATFDDGEHHWELTTEPVIPDGSTITTAPVTFLVAGGEGSAVVGGPADEPSAWRLASGEATYAGAGGDIVARATGSGATTLTAVSAVSGPGTDPFNPGAGTFDVDLVRDVLTTNEALLLASDVAVFVVVTDGEVTAADATIAAGTGVTLFGDVTLINRGTDAAVVFAAVVGPRVDGATAPSATEPTNENIPSAPSDPSGTAPTTTAAATASTSTTTSTTSTTTAPIDTDNDGLTDSEEAALGTDPAVPDSDGDGIPDGREVDALGSNPLDTDTDSDGLTDALEVDHSCDINAPDTDGDGLGDAFEANSGFSECSIADTDGDGDDDLAEFSLGTDPRDPASHS